MSFYRCVLQTGARIAKKHALIIINIILYNKGAFSCVKKLIFIKVLLQKVWIELKLLKEREI